MDFRHFGFLKLRKLLNNAKAHLNAVVDKNIVVNKK